MKGVHISLRDVVILFSSFYEVAEANKAELCQLDSLLGDGDLGVSLARGFCEVARRIPGDNSSIADYLRNASVTFNDAASSTCGTLCAVGLRRAALEVKEKENLSIADVIGLLDVFCVEVMSRGGAKVGDKTFLDVLIPSLKYCKEMVSAGVGPTQWLGDVLDVLREAEKETRALVPQRGRARMFRDRAVGVPDAGAVAALKLCEVLFDWLRRF